MANTVFASNQVKIEFKKKDGTFAPLIETTGITNSTEGNIDERDTYDSTFTKRTFTGGKKIDFEFETKLVPGDAVHDELRKMALSDDVKEHNDRVIKFTFPKANKASATPRTEEYNGVIQITQLGGTSSLELASLNFNFKSSGKPTIVEEK